MNLEIKIGRMRMKNPVMTASGCSGYGEELSRFFDLGRLGAFVTKAITIEPREGHPPPRLVETRAGMLNAIGLANVGLDVFIKEKLPALALADVPVVVNVAGSRKQEYIEICRRLGAEKAVDAVEVNVSCPNVEEGGMEFGTEPRILADLIKSLRRVLKEKTLIVKLTPNVTDIVPLAKAAADAGADALSAINTLRGLAVDVATRRPVLSNGTGGLSGPAIKPVALYMVNRIWREVARDRNIPVIGIGGIQFAADAIEFFLAGASAVQIGTANFVDPTSAPKIIDGIGEYLSDHGHAKITDIVGTLEGP